MNFTQIAANVRANLSDAGITYYDADYINNSLQDAYNEVAAKTRCIIKSVTLNQLANKNYYDFLALGVTDYIATIGIFNLDTQFWLRDDINLRDFDRIRRDWELWTGEPQFWASHSKQYIAVCPTLPAIVGNTNQFTLWYWAQAPSISANSGVPLIATDMQSILEKYSTADLLEGAEELTKSSVFWAEYEMDKEKYKERCVKLAAADLLLRI